MRALLVALVGLIALGTVPAALVDDASAQAPDIPAPALPDAPGTPDASVPPALPEATTLPGAPSLPGAPDVALPLDPPASPILAPLPRGPLENAGWMPLDPGALPLPPPAVAATAAGSLALALFGFALYSRLARSEILDHKRREEIQTLVKENPGITLTEIAQRTGLGWGTAVYHLDRLERAGFLATERASGRRCYFPIGTVAKDARAGLGALQQDTTREVAAFVAARPGATQSDLCEGLGLSASAASKQVSKLESVGLVRREREWKTVRLHPAPALAQLLTGGATATA